MTTAFHYLIIFTEPQRVTTSKKPSELDSRHSEGTANGRVSPPGLSASCRGVKEKAKALTQIEVVKGQKGHGAQTIKNRSYDRLLPRKIFYTAIHGLFSFPPKILPKILFSE